MSILASLLALALAAPVDAFEEDPLSAVSPGTVRLSASTSGGLSSWTYSSSGVDQHVTTLSVAGEGVLFLWSNVAVGGTLSYGRTAYRLPSSPGTEPDLTTSERIRVGPVVLVHIPVSRVAITLEGAAYYGHDENRYTGNLRSTADGLGVGAAAGVAIFLAPSVSVDLRATIEGQRWEVPRGEGANAVGWSTTAGLSFYLGKD